MCKLQSAQLVCSDEQCKFESLFIFAAIIYRTVQSISLQ